jgi:hypothetical protein
MLVEGNLISRGAGGDSVQMRVGGVARGNTFLWNHTALSLGHAEAKRDRLQDGLVEQNLVLHDEHFLPPGGWGNGFILGAGDQETATARDNLVLHFHRGTNGGAMIMARGMPGNPQERAKAVSIIDNVLVSHETPPIRLVAGLDNPWGVATATVAGNAIYWPEGKSAAISDVPPKPDLFQIGSTAVGGNAYFMPQWPGLSAWQQLGFDQASTAYSSAPAMAAAKGWRPNAAQLDIVSYVRSIDPTYQPDENVTVDFGVPDAKRNPNAPKVWEVLMDPTRFGGDLPKMTEERAKLTARRFHAFVTFIQRARLNRRGNWDERYTSQAINNYFRGAFGRKPYLGPVAAPR